MRSIKIEPEIDSRRKLLWCFFWANRAAIRTEGCAPFLIEEIVTSKAKYAPELGKILRISNDLFRSIEEDMECGIPVDFKINIGDEKFEISFRNKVISVSTARNKEIEEEIIENLNEELKRGKPQICPSFPQRAGINFKI